MAGSASIYSIEATTDPDNPQDVATMTNEKEALLASIFRMMNEISYREEIHTVTVTVETDDGSGPQDGLSDHVGIVEKVEDGLVYAIEGNTSDTCTECWYPIDYYEILGTEFQPIAPPYDRNSRIHLLHRTSCDAPTPWCRCIAELFPPGKNT